MCIFAPKPPPLPDPPVAPPKPEKTAKAPTIGRKRKSVAKTGLGMSKRSTKRTGTSSLRIPRVNSGRDLNY